MSLIEKRQASLRTAAASNPILHLEVGPFLAGADWTEDDGIVTAKLDVGVPRILEVESLGKRMLEVRIGVETFRERKRIEVAS